MESLQYILFVVLIFLIINLNRKKIKYEDANKSRYLYSQINMIIYSLFFLNCFILFTDNFLILNIMINIVLGSILGIISGFFQLKNIKNKIIDNEIIITKKEYKTRMFLVLVFSIIFGGLFIYLYHTFNIYQSNDFKLFKQYLLLMFSLIYLLPALIILKFVLNYEKINGKPLLLVFKFI